jgi:transposase InsO family protein
MSWLLCVSLGALSGWNREFDEQLRQHPKSDERGKASKVNIEVVRLVVETAQGILDRDERLYVDRFTRFLQAEKGLELSRITVQEILVANGLWQTRTRKKRPKFFKNLCQRIPNGLFSCDGGEFEVVLGDQTLKYNVELGVDVGSFCHTSHAITSTETSDAVLKVLEDHCREWGIPLGVVFDHGSANISEKVGQYLQKRGIEVVPAGPGNPKGNGSLESAIGQLRETLGPIKIDMSSDTAMGQSILDVVISLYRKMRNKLPLRNPRPSPFEQMTAPTSEHERQLERNRLAAHKQSKDKTDTDIEKVEKIHWLVKFHELMPEPAALKRAEQSIRRHDMEAIIKSEEAFLKAVNRNPSRRNLSYFFGILRNIQQDMDDQRYEQYCRKKYSHSFFLEREREKQTMENAPTIAGIISIANSVLALTAQGIKKIATRTCRMRLEQLLSTKKYLGPIRKQIQEVIGDQKDLALEQKEKLANFIDELINQTVTE